MMTNWFTPTAITAEIIHQSYRTEQHNDGVGVGVGDDDDDDVGATMKLNMCLALCVWVCICCVPMIATITITKLLSYNKIERIHSLFAIFKKTEVPEPIYRVFLLSRRLNLV